METPETSSYVQSLLALMIVVSTTAVVVKWVRVPYPVALVIAGLIVGISRIVPPVTMTPDLVLLVFLPALLFEASWNLDLKSLQRDWLPISILATVGVVMCMFGVAAVLHFAGGINVPTAMLFGAMISATDPVSVIALFRQMGIDKRLTMILEGESLFNDGTAVVLFKIVLLLVITGGKFSLESTLSSFALVVAGGATIGVALGFIASQVTRMFDDHLLEITLTTVTAYGAYLAAESVHVSPVMAVVAAGIVLGNYGSHTGMSVTTRLAVNSFWEYAAFLGNSLLFLLIGLQVKISLLLGSSKIIGITVLAVIVARMLVVYGICPFVSTERRPIPDRWRHLMFWGGLRGALVMALALSLPTTFKDREIIINMAFGVVLFTLLVPGLTMEPLIRLLGMSPKTDALDRYQECNALITVYNSELDMLSKLRKANKISAASYESWKSELQHQLEHSHQEIVHLGLSDSSLDEMHDTQTKVQLLESRKDIFARLAREGSLSSKSAHKLNLAIDLELDALQVNTHGDSAEAKPAAQIEESKKHSPEAEDSPDQQQPSENGPQKAN